MRMARAVVLAGVIVVTIVAVCVRAAATAPSWMEAAERLDLGAGEHNRIATALDFVRQHETRRFAVAAIQDGMNALHVLQDREPAANRIPSRGRQTAGIAVMVLALTLVAGLFAHLVDLRLRAGDRD